MLESKDFVIANARHGEVQVEVFVAGDGINYPKKGQTVVVHYIAYLQDGKKFDSSRDREKPFKFKLGAEQFIPDLDEAVERLCMKERAKIFVPSDKPTDARVSPGSCRRSPILYLIWSCSRFANYEVQNPTYVTKLVIPVVVAGTSHEPG